METCILIPKELSLVLRVKTPGCSVAPGSSTPTGEGQTIRSLFPEMGAALWANRTLPPGLTLKPDQGEMRLDKLEIYTLLEGKDVRQDFGCHDTIIDVEGCDVRHCNWVRFVTSSSDRDAVNAVASMMDGEPVYEVIKEIRPNDELVVYFDVDDAEENEDIDVVAEDEPLRKMPEDFLEITPPRGEDGSSEMETTVESPSDVSSLSETSPILPSNPHAKEVSSSNPRLSMSFTPNFNQTGTPDSRSSSSDQQTTPSCERYNTVWTGFSPQTGTPAPCTPHKFTREIEMKMMQGPLRRKEKTWLPCDVCGKKFDRPSLLKRHMRTHTGEKPHACDVCGKAFSTSSSLNTHRRIHSGEKPHQCQICGKRFTASSNLYYHRMTHKKEKPHKCSLCAKSFPTPGDLKSHMYVHNGSWPFKCEVCSRGFSKQTNLKNHMLLHSGDKPHECPLCHKKFALQCNLRTHLKTHEGETREDRCINCSQPFGGVSQDDSKLCSNCVNKPKNRFSIDSLVSPEHPTKPNLLPVAPYPYAMTSSPTELPKPPFYARAMMSAVAYGSVAGHPRYSNMPLNWPERPIPHRYGM